jgi:acyl dehydratase
MKYFEDYKVGQYEESQGRTVTETDVVNFSNLSWDHKSIHTDEEYAKLHTPFGTRVSHGMLGLVIASGLIANLNIFRDIAVFAFTKFSWEFKRPIYMNDTLRVKVEIVEKEERPGKDTGIIRMDRKVLNQKDTVVQQGVSEMIVYKRKDN